jgi:hypothetical protein
MSERLFQAELKEDEVAYRHLEPVKFEQHCGE